MKISVLRIFSPGRPLGKASVPFSVGSINARAGLDPSRRTSSSALQAVQILCVYLLAPGYSLDEAFGKRLAAVLALVILTGVFCVIFWLLKVMRPAGRREQA